MDMIKSLKTKAWEYELGHIMNKIDQSMEQRNQQLIS